MKAKNPTQNDLEKKVASLQIGAGFLFTFLVLLSCAQKPNFYTLPAMVGENTINVVVEIPAGTNTKYEYDTIQKAFIIDQEDGKDRIIDFLPYPANYGFVPSTLAKIELGGDGDALDVLVLTKSLQASPLRF